MLCRNECKAEVEKFPKARYKKFDSELDAKAFVSGFDHPGIAGTCSYNHIFEPPCGKTNNVVFEQV